MSADPTPRSSTPGPFVVLTCGDVTAQGWAGDLGEALGGTTEIVAVPRRPGRADVDPVLDRPALAGTGRLVVAGGDDDLAAVLVRLLRRERLDVPVAFLPWSASEVAAVWGVPTGPRHALDVAREGAAAPAPLVRDDRGGVVVGAHRVGAFDGVVYCDEREVVRGEAAGLVVRPDPAGGPAAVGGVTVTVTRRRRLGGLLRGAELHARGRAATIGCRPAALHRDGVDEDRPLERRSWYRHTADWILVRPADAVPTANL
ncbi:hypothetical protein LQ327_05940 [Actinomycetospora endophytica]|uniref:DAGKc domain-containing protein n=1 Tax=Actinomycetospora endophytica TaxID=2291215 RepID=A0ABS8P3U4_9PSEU|nr:hypothetical protein [Actinomycetospora endophytica]MCD2192929.1 hypothetical protein [Actinomycetospora endophytica]